MKELNKLITYQFLWRKKILNVFMKAAHVSEIRVTTQLMFLNKLSLQMLQIREKYGGHTTKL